MQCTGAAESGVFKWTEARRSWVIEAMSLGEVSSATGKALGTAIV